jgi:hypothetical protein
MADFRRLEAPSIKRSPTPGRGTAPSVGGAAKANSNVNDSHVELRSWT